MRVLFISLAFIFIPVIPNASADEDKQEWISDCKKYDENRRLFVKERRTCGYKYFFPDKNISFSVNYKIDKREWDEGVILISKSGTDINSVKIGSSSSNVMFRHQCDYSINKACLIKNTILVRSILHLSKNIKHLYFSINEDNEKHSIEMSQLSSIFLRQLQNKEMVSLSPEASKNWELVRGILPNQLQYPPRENEIKKAIIYKKNTIEIEGGTRKEFFWLFGDNHFENKFVLYQRDDFSALMTSLANIVYIDYQVDDGFIHRSDCLFVRRMYPMCLLFGETRRVKKTQKKVKFWVWRKNAFTPEYVEILL